MSSPEPASPTRRHSWPLFTRAASPSGAGVPAQPASRAVKLLVITLCTLLLLAPSALLFLGAPAATASPSARLWARGPAHILAAARQTFLGKYLPKPQRTSTTLPYPVEDGSYVSTSPGSSHSIAKIHDFPAHSQAYSSNGISTSLQAFLQQVPQHASWAAGALLALPGSVGQQLGLTKRSSWSDSLLEAPLQLFRSSLDKLRWNKPASWQDSLQAWYTGGSTQLADWSHSLQQALVASWQWMSTQLSAAVKPSDWRSSSSGLGRSVTSAYRHLQLKVRPSSSCCTDDNSIGRCADEIQTSLHHAGHI